eukprot:CAMPEP_0204597722 /NCGR_PEP_ID=MMETSP0661-20131031/53952_1 /ASSEMBLY_ACC=CAM_ASM_000606 /TAXON_ID=109239 /ORGANISM="Alexandrium margalefi, Strain AMGDE01CS-322" /LENGTH=179 /DNA_ID=CAMNT_0051608419 /DNA_START=108 /DNA_END=645 /DNA_ORIENTATION=-
MSMTRPDFPAASAPGVRGGPRAREGPRSDPASARKTPALGAEALQPQLPLRVVKVGGLLRRGHVLLEQEQAARREALARAAQEVQSVLVGEVHQQPLAPDEVVLPPGDVELLRRAAVEAKGATGLPLGRKPLPGHGEVLPHKLHEVYVAATPAQHGVRHPADAGPAVQGAAEPLPAALA